METESAVLHRTHRRGSRRQQGREAKALAKISQRRPEFLKLSRAVFYNSTVSLLRLAVLLFLEGFFHSILAHAVHLMSL
jgi:hypothetical protein